MLLEKNQMKRFLLVCSKKSPQRDFYGRDFLEGVISMHRLTKLYFDQKKLKPDTEKVAFHEAVTNAMLERHTEEEVEWAIRSHPIDTLVYVARGIDRMLIQRAAEEVKRKQRVLHINQPLSHELIAHNRRIYEQK